MHGCAVTRAPGHTSKVGASNCMKPPYLPGQPCHAWRHPARHTVPTPTVSRLLTQTLVNLRSHCFTQSHTRGADAKHFTLLHCEKRAVVGPHPDARGVTASALSALTTPESFADSIYTCLGDNTTSGEVVLFIHGSNESWPNAIKKAAQLTWDTTQASSAAAAAAADSTPGRRIALAFDWASTGHGGPFTLTSHKDDKGINAAQDQLPVLLQILEELVSSRYACCLLNSGCQLLVLPVCCCNVAACVHPQEKSSVRLSCSMSPSCWACALCWNAHDGNSWGTGTCQAAGLMAYHLVGYDSASP